MSRRHAELWLEDGVLRVKRLPGAANPIYYLGEAQDEFAAEPGVPFVIGRTRFRLLAADAPEAPMGQTPTPRVDATLGPQELYALGASSDRLRLHDLLELPAILRTRDRRAFHLHIASLLRLATGARWACVAGADGRVLGEDAEDDTAPRPGLSRALLAKALESAPNPTLYCWDRPAEFLATAGAGVSWALCAASRIAGDESFLYYAAGAGQQELSTLRESARFVGLVADIVSRSLSNEHLQLLQARLSHFFAGPVVEKILSSPDMAALEPRLAESTVLFFDIRGSPMSMSCAGRCRR